MMQGNGTVHVVHLSSAHPSDDVRINIKECKSLVELGYRVDLVAVDSQQFRQDGAIGIYGISPWETRKDRWSRSLWQVYRRAIILDADVYHFHDPELIPIGMLLRLRGKRVIYDAHEDIAAQVLDKPWIPPVMRSAVASLARTVETVGQYWFSHIIAATPAIGRNFGERRVTVIQNFPLVEEVPDAINTPFRERPRKIAYVGRLTHRGGGREMIQAMGLLPKSVVAELEIAGIFRYESLREAATADPGWSRVDYRGWISRTSMNKMLTQARAGIILYHPAANHVEAQPNKLFEYMAAGLPVIASDFPHWRSLITECDCGIVVDPLDPEAVAEAILHILENPDDAEEMGRRARKAVVERYNWTAEAKKLDEVYKEIFD